MSVAMLLLPARAADTVVANYRANFQGGTFPPRWQYLWNANGPITDPVANLVPLQADSATVWDTDASTPGEPDATPGSFCMLTPVGGHPGNGNPDRYAVAAYTIGTNDGSGYYAITNSFITLTNVNLGGSADGVDVRVFTSSGYIALIRTVFALSTTNYDVAVGWLNPGDTIYVAFGENGGHSRDHFAHDFSIVRIGSPPPPQSSVVPRPLLSQLDYFNRGFPKSFFFRREGAANTLTYSTWRSNYSRLDGCMMKAETEEIPTPAPNTAAYLRQFARDYPPAEFSILHFNGIAGDPAYLSNNLSAGHYLYLPGTGITQDIAPDDTVINVQNGALFLTGIGISNTVNDQIVIVPLDGGGNKLWDQAEHASIDSISGNQLTVTRNIYGLAPAPGSFTAGQAWVAAHSYDGPWGNTFVNHLLWRYNFSDVCPTNALGQKCSDALASFLANKFIAGGPLADFSGIQFDVATFELGRFNGRLPDINNDGVGDSGGVLATDRINHYGLGLHQFFVRLRELLGPGRLIMADGGEHTSQRSVTVLNGMEAEGFAGPNDDPFLKEWSSNLNRFGYWRLVRRQPFDFSYIVHKDTLLTTHPTNLTRQVLATAQALGVGVPYVILPPTDPGEDVGIWDELRRGTDNVTHWLGTPRGPMLRLATNSTDLLNGAGRTVTAAFAAAWTSTNAFIQLESGRLHATNKPGNVNPMKFSFSLALLVPAVTLPAGDLFFRMQLQADALTGFPADIPRKITVTVTNRVASTNTAGSLYSLAGPSDYAEATFYFREAGPASNLVINLEVEGTNDFRLADFTLLNAPDLIVREFVNGAVLINPSTTNATFDLATLFPGRSFRRLTGRANQDPVVNNGAAVGASVVIPPRDGLFLLKTADTSLNDSDNDGLPDAWELQFAANLGVLGHSGNPISTVDFDGDGTSDIAEYRAGTNPNNAASSLALRQISFTNSTWRLQWDTVPGLSYRLRHSTNLTDWSVLGSPAEGLGGPQSFWISPVLLPTDTRGFFKIGPE